MRYLQIAATALILLTAVQCRFSAEKKENKIVTVKEYQCLPCGLECDKLVLDADTGVCPKCQMELVDKATVTFGSVETSQLKDYIQKHPGLILLDVRTKEEFEGKADPDFGTLKNAINIPVQELKTRMAELDSFKTRDILVYCSHSHRSPRASYMLVKSGFLKVVNMNGGMSLLTDKSLKKQ